MTLLYTLFALFVALSIADGITTWKALKRQGTREANPVLRFLFDRFGTAQTLVATKCAAIAAVWYTMGPYSLWVLGGWSAVYAWAIWNNHYRAGR